MMKTRWSLDYLWRKHNNNGREVHAWTMAKMRQLEQTTGVPWSYCDMANHRGFEPYLRLRDTEPLDEETAVIAFIDAVRQEQHKVITRIVPLRVVAELSGLGYIDTMRVAAHLVRSRRANQHVDRRGYPVYIKLRD